MTNSEKSSGIRPIEKGAVHRICSGQVVLDLATAVKELVENSLDAGATSIEIKLREYGAELIEVADNGPGISPDDYEGLTKKYYTSKISAFGDLQSLTSFGFRGEALSSLCALADVSVTTRTAAEAVASRLEYDHAGCLVRRTGTARAVGTTVAAARLFLPLPVRHREFSRNVKREYGRLATLLQAYAVISTGVRILCTNRVLRGVSSTVVQTPGAGSLRDNIVNVFGTKTAACLDPVDLTLSDGVRVAGFVSKPGAGCGRASPDRQLFYINGRPIDFSKLGKLLNEVYRSFNSMQYPMAVLNLEIPTASYDVNVTPDKRKVFLHGEGQLLVALRQALEGVYAPHKYTYAVKKLELPKGGILVGEEGTAFKKSLMEGTDGKKRATVVEAEEDEMELVVVEKLKDQQLEEEVEKDEDRLEEQEVVEEEKLWAAAEAAFAAQAKEVMEIEQAEEEGDEGTDQEDDAEEQVKGVEVGFAVNKVQGKERLGLREDEGLWGIRRHSRSDAEGTKSAADAKQMLFGGDATEEDIAAGRRSSTVRAAGAREVKGDEGIQRALVIAGARPRPASLDTFMFGASDRPVQHPLGRGLGSRGTKKQSTLKGFAGGANFRQPALERLEEASTLRLGARGKFSPGEEGNQEAPAVIASLDGGAGKEVGVGEVSRAVCMSQGAACECHSEEPQSCGGHLRELPQNEGEVTAGQPRPGYIPRDPPQLGQEMSAEMESESVGAPSPLPGAREGIVAQFDLQQIKRRRQEHHGRGGTKFSPDNRMEASHTALKRRRRRFSAATLDAGVANGGAEKGAVLAAAEEELERSFCKREFGTMVVLGQFNLGFILARLASDLFIIDQHASDEKFNFERLTKSTVLNRQPLLRPVPMELTASEEITVLSHLDAFRQNGFDFVEDPDGSAGRRLSLSSVPFSRTTTFGPGDVHELISLLADVPSPSSPSREVLPCVQPPTHRNPAATGGEEAEGSFLREGSSAEEVLPPGRSSSGLGMASVVRPSRVRAMLASRACRSSIMIGTALSTTQMERVLKNLSGLDAPWNCPHGRPTMRHLVDLNAVKARQIRHSPGRPKLV